jgi:hypothetical protein
MPYSGTIVVDDKEGGRVNSDFHVRLAESFLRETRGADYLGHWGGAFDECTGGALKNTISAKHGVSYDSSIVIGLPGIGLHLLFRESVCKGHFYFPLDRGDELVDWSEKSAVDPSMRLRAGTLLDENQRIFILGDFKDEPWSRPAIYRIETDEWVYPDNAVTRHRLEKPTLETLDDGTVLIVGGRKCHLATGCVVYDSGEIFDPETNTFKSLGVNPMMSLLKEQNISRPHINTVKLEDGRVLIVEARLNPIALSVFDPATEEFYLVEPEEQFTQDVGNSSERKVFICDVQPILLQGGRVFLGGSLLSADLKTMEYLDSNESGTTGHRRSGCILTDNIQRPDFNEAIRFELDGSAQLKLEDGRILLVGEALPPSRGEAWIFDGTSYRMTMYQPNFSRRNPYLVYDSLGNIVVFGGTKTESPYIGGREMEVFVTASLP